MAPPPNLPNLIRPSIIPKKAAGPLPKDLHTVPSVDHEELDLRWSVESLRLELRHRGLSEEGNKVDLWRRLQLRLDQERAREARDEAAIDAFIAAADASAAPAAAAFAAPAAAPAAATATAPAPVPTSDDDHRAHELADRPAPHADLPRQDLNLADSVLMAQFVAAASTLKGMDMKTDPDGVDKALQDALALADRVTASQIVHIDAQRALDAVNDVHQQRALARRPASGLGLPQSEVDRMVSRMVKDTRAIDAMIRRFLPGSTPPRVPQPGNARSGSPQPSIPQLLPPVVPAACSRCHGAMIHLGDRAAGMALLRRIVKDGPLMIVLQQRHDRTWTIPGGISDVGEATLGTAMREAREECGITDHQYRMCHNVSPYMDVHPLADGRAWSFTTYFAHVIDPEFHPAVTDGESVAMEWRDVEEVAALPLHPGMALSWPDVKARIYACRIR
ncbi:hypothetical protein JX265_002699 [Neoarthrinium moseri]|uniref:Nudix hydrolase domain-containing protein n=1 Tax=Neoarthrinium moseri TaxID=1658444 RepID=A0A9P9WVD1_9PEZI|nr:uncharacterized protein JN550_000511 [Neoarthrinium moseri]KAI1842695.1 hypothetical protein JX266_011157 [Neoarthrinium moseri]KAI1878329.1 hypothetical protein JN550_000511 [Neoarthrinium moseri]KAI1879745.1 hypothetical protein JX265_002699 [Neoarthrinium moseri]